MNSQRLSRRIYENILRQLCWWVWAGLYRSYRIVQYQDEQRHVAAQHQKSGGFILACWHEHLIMASMAQKGWAFRPIASRSFSGRLMGHVLNKFGFDCVYGSQNKPGRNKGGQESRQVLKQAILDGSPSAFTVDGSTGPRRYVKPGVVWLARETSCPIVPVAAAAESFWELKTWDRLKIPKPFSKIHVVYGELMTVSKGEDFTEKQEQVKLAIDCCEKQALQYAHGIKAATLQQTQGLT